MKHLFTFIVCLMVVCSARATWTITADNTSLTNMLANATDGTNVVILPGTITLLQSIGIGGATDTWGNQSRHVAINLQGSGSNSTHWVSGGHYTWWRQDSSSSNLLTIANIDFIGDASDSTPMIIIGDNPGSAAWHSQFHIYYCQMTNCLNHGFDLGGAGAFGLIDNCLLVDPAGSGGYNPIITHGNAYFSWTNSNSIGTTNEVYIEDCKFINNSGTIGNGFLDQYNGSQTALRHCILDGTTALGAHGYDSQLTSMRTFELYANIFTNQNSSSANIGVSRGGVYECFSNTIWISAGTATAATVAPTLQYYRGANGSYQSGLGYAGYALTNKYKGTATGGSASTLVDVNAAGTYGAGFTGGTIRYADEYDGQWTISIISGTGNGQTLAVINNTATTFTVIGTFSPVPDSTSVYQLQPVLGGSYSIGFQKYKFVNSISGGNNIAYQVLIGANIAATLSNLRDCVNLVAAGAGVTYAAATPAANPDLRALSVDSTAISIIYTNILDGISNSFGVIGYPAAMQSSVLTVQAATNIGVTQFPCYSASNLVHNLDTTLSNVNFGLNFAGDPANGLNYVTNLIVLKRDYYNDTLPAYTPLVYPHPLNNEDAPVTNIVLSGPNAILMGTFRGTIKTQ